MSWWERQWYKMLGGDVAIVGNVGVSTLTAANLTAGRVPFADANKKLVDDSDLTFAGSTLTATTFSGGNVTSGADPGHTHTAYLQTSALTPGDWSLSGSDFSAGGSMGVDNVTITRAKYAQFGKLVWIHLAVTLETTGTADNDLYVDALPVTAAAANQLLSCRIEDGAATVAGFAFLSTTGQIQIRKYDASNWAIGADRRFYITGVYQAA
jgi:hypothetical protein